MIDDISAALIAFNKIRYRDRIVITCDNVTCDKTWTTTWGVYKNKKLDLDYCRGCKNRLGISGVKGGHSPDVREAWANGGIKKVRSIDQSCDWCQKIFKRNINQIKERVFCSTTCRHLSDAHNRYGHLDSIFSKKPDEVAYLVGLILGDGHVKKTSKEAVNISISFDLNHLDLIKIAEEIFSDLHLNCSTYSRNNFVIISFHLPILLSNKISLGSGNKINWLININDSIVSNIHFAVGLINSDGYRIKRYKYSGRRIQFTNTVKWIIDYYTECLRKNNIQYSLNKTLQKHKNWRDRFDVHISKKKDIELIEKNIKIPLRKEAIVK